MCRLSSLELRYQIAGCTTDALPKISEKHRGALPTITVSGVGVESSCIYF